MWAWLARLGAGTDDVGTTAAVMQLKLLTSASTMPNRSRPDMVALYGTSIPMPSTLTRQLENVPGSPP